MSFKQLSLGLVSLSIAGPVTAGILLSLSPAGCARKLTPKPVQSVKTQYLNPFEISGQKVHLSEKQDPVPKGTVLSVLIDEECSEGRSIRGRSSIQSFRRKLTRDRTLEDIRKTAAQNNCVKGISLNRVATVNGLGSDPLLPADPMIGQQRHLQRLGSAKNYDDFFELIQSLKHEIVIAVIDTGIDGQHPDLHEHLWTNEKEKLGLAGVDDDENGFIDDIHGFDFDTQIGDPSHKTVFDHGTHVAGLAAAVSSNGIGGMGLVGQNVRIMSLNVFGRNLGADTVSIDRAIRYAADNGAHVINISVGGPGNSDTTAAAITYALKKGSLIVTSAGNDRMDISENFYFPASYSSLYPGMISVGATDAKDGKLCPFSNFGLSVVQVAAPGCDADAPKTGLLSTRSRNRYGHKRGTSMAAPLVSAALGLFQAVLSEESDQAPNPAEIEKEFLTASKSLPHLTKHISEGRTLTLDSLLQRRKK